MESNQSVDNNSNEAIEAVVGIFADQADASRVAASMRGPDLKLQRVSRENPAATDTMPNIVYDEIDEIPHKTVAKGVLQGGAIGAGSGLLLLGVPVLNVLAPIGAALAGAFIGGVAGADEANRNIELPNLADYQRALAEGKSIIVISGTATERMAYENQMKELGAIETHQHPPTLHAVRTPKK